MSGVAGVKKHVFEFAMGPGSVQPAWRFDIREGREDQLRLLEERSPELYKRLMVQGARPMIQLLENGRWQLDIASNEGRVFDIETGGRWEWHGGRRVRVVHGGGKSWTYQDHTYQPVLCSSKRLVVTVDLALTFYLSERIALRILLLLALLLHGFL